MEIDRNYLERCTPGYGKILDGDKLLMNFFTLELPWKDNQRMVSCIPGNGAEYTVWKCLPTKNRPYEFLWVKDVPNRDSILFHPGNYTSQILGCILPGDSHVFLNKDDIVDVANTTATLKKITDIVPNAFKLIIR